MSDDAITRRDALCALGAGLLVAIAAGDADAQSPRRDGERGGTGDPRGNVERPPAVLTQRFHLGADGVVTVMTGKVECGQGARAQITQAAGEELRVAPSQVRVIMGDTELCPDDGITAGSRTTPRTIPTVRQAAAIAREALVDLAATRWNVDRAQVEARDGALRHADGRSIAYAEFAGDGWAKLAAATPATREGVTLTPIDQWTVLGQSLNRPNGRDVVVGTHEYPSDIRRPGMLYGKVLRPPSIGATLDAIDLDAAKGDGVVVTRAENFVGVAAPKSFLARRAIDTLARTATWRPNPPVDFDRLYDHLRATAKDPSKLGPLAAASSTTPADVVRREYRVAYVQHVPLEPRAAVAEWIGERLTVWTATQNPMRVRDELAAAFKIANSNVRVIVPDFGGGFGGKHTGECAVEAARLAKAAGKSVSLRWTRDEEFTWASFRPAALIGVEATLADDGRAIAAWSFTNVNSGNSGLRSPYSCGSRREEYVESNAPPLRHGSYRGLAATANHFARECFVDELADRAGVDPLAYRLALLDEPRMRDVLNAAADKFGWAARRAKTAGPTRGVGLACGTEKGSFTAACVEVEIDAATKAIRVVHVAQSYECGKIQNPMGLDAQVKGAIVQAIGPALWEAIAVRGGVVTNGRLKDYRVPRFGDVPTIELALLDRPDLESVGAGETPIVALAPAIANAVFHATGRRVREMPVRLV